MLNSYKYHLYPNSSQEAELRNHLGAARWMYNRALNIKKFAYEKDKTNISAYDLIKMITQMKQDPETAWLSEVPIAVLQQSVLNLEKAYSKFFKNAGNEVTFDEEQ